MEEDEASGPLNPAEKPFGGAIQPAADPTKLSEEIVALFHRLADFTDTRLALAPRRGLQAKAGDLSPLPGGSIAIGAIGLGRGQTPDIEFCQGSGQGRRRYD